LHNAVNLTCFTTDLSLPIIPFGSTRANDSLSECIEMFLRPEILDGVNQYYAESVDRKVDAIKGLKFGRLPQIVSCNLKRFVFDFTSENITQKKLNDVVRFPMILDMNRYVSKRRERSPSLSLREPIDPCEDTQDDDFEVFLREQINLLRSKAKSNGGTSPAPDIDDDDPTLPDLVDVNGVKCPEQQAIDEKLKLKQVAEEKVWTKEEVDKLIADRGEWVYELFAVLIHSGAIAGGHYYAYIKNLDAVATEWWNFNDSSVTKLDESKVRDAWGGMNTYNSATYGRVSTQSCANAYMLMYRKVVPSSKMPPLPDGNSSTASSTGFSQAAASRLARYEVPDYIREEILKLEEESVQKSRAAEELKNRISIKVSSIVDEYITLPEVGCRSFGRRWST
jgi:ubiquitin carboxyl-terminal hydrolase 47